MTDRQRRVLDLRKQGRSRDAIAGELGCSVVTVARDLAALRRQAELPVDLMTIDTRRAVVALMEAEAEGRLHPANPKTRGDLAMQVYKSMDEDSRALVRRPSLRAFADSIRRSKSTAHREVQKLGRGSGRLVPADKVRDELRMALNAVKRARRLLESAGWQATEAAWRELNDLTDEVDEVNQRAEDPDYSPAQAALDALRARGGGPESAPGAAGSIAT
jgi:hypothetical protein